MDIAKKFYIRRSLKWASPIENESGRSTLRNIDLPVTERFVEALGNWRSD